jgi:hypothetical protein
MELAYIGLILVVILGIVLLHSYSKRNVEPVIIEATDDKNAYYCGMCGWCDIRKPCKHHPGA